MLKEKSLPELQQTLRQLTIILEELNQNGTDEKKYDYPMMPKNELTQTMQGKASTTKKKKILLTQIGFARISLFNRYYQRIQQAEKNNQLNQAVEFMEAYVEPTAIPFINTKKQNTLTERLKRLFSETKLPEPNEEIQKWKTAYDAWQRQDKMTYAQAANTKQLEDYNTLKRSFITLYTISFSAKDFPPLRNKPSELY